jgi:hypothetical protein
MRYSRGNLPARIASAKGLLEAGVHLFDQRCHDLPIRAAAKIGDAVPVTTMSRR